MYLTNRQIEVIKEAEKIIKETTEKAKQSLELGNALGSLFGDNCLYKKDTNDKYLIGLYDKVNEGIKDFIFFCADNNYREVFKISELNKVEGLPDEVIKRFTVLISKIIELKIYKITGKKINELQ